MFEFKGNNNNGVPPVKAFVTAGDLPHYIERGQTPRAKKPFSTILQQSFTHTINLLLPEELYTIIWSRIETLSNISYSRVNLSLSDVLEKDFLNAYIKSGSTQLLSQGRPGLDPLFWLKDGILHLELPKSLYERAGLQGKPIRDGGQKHVKTRFAVDLNLRLPSMVHGKKGFERIKWAFRNVLNHSVTWLLLDLDAGKGGEGESRVEPDPLERHHPFGRSIGPTKTVFSSVLTPVMALSLCLSSGADTSIFDEETCDLQEWLDLAGMGSPRLRSKDTIDPYLCRYDVPGGRDAAEMCNLVRLQWRGFLSAVWIRDLFAECLTATRTHGQAWFALSGFAFPTEAVDGQSGYTILRLPTEGVGLTGRVDAALADSSGEKQVHHTPPKYLLWQMSSGHGGNA